MAHERLKIEVPAEEAETPKERRPSIWVDLQRFRYRRGSAWHDVRKSRQWATVAIVIIIFLVCLGAVVFHVMTLSDPGTPTSEQTNSSSTTPLTDNQTLYSNTLFNK